MIGIGINENVVLLKAELTDKDWLALTFDSLENLTKEKKSVFDDLQTAKVENEGQTGITLNVFPFKKPTGQRNENKTEDELIEMVSDDMKRCRTKLTQLMEQFLTNEDINKVWNPYVGTGIDKDNYRQKFMDDEALKTVFRNYAGQFIQLMSPFFGDPKYTLRLKLARQSKDKAFATIADRFLQDNPYVELMDVPKEASRVKFTKWETENGLDNATPVARPTATEEAAAGIPEGDKNVFGTR